MYFFSKKVEHSRIIIIGAGEVGYHIATRLAGEHKQVVVIDRDQDALRRIEDKADVQTICGSGASPSVLVEAGAKDAQIFLAVTDSDETNLVTCLFANTLAPQAVKVARLRDEEYTTHLDVLKNPAINISALVNPEQEIVRTIERLLTLPGAVEYGEFAEGRIRVAGMEVSDGPLVGQPLRQFRKIVDHQGIMVGAIARGNKLIIPSGDDVLQQGDIAWFVHTHEAQPRLLHVLNRTREFLSSASIIGGGNIGLRLARLFESRHISVKLVEKDARRCAELADKLDKTLILHGDGTDKQLLIEEELAETDAFITVTGDEESNVLSCLLAKSLNARETVARVNKTAYLPILKAVGIDHSVSPRLSAVNSILHFIRPNDVLSSFTVDGDNAEIMEMIITETSRLTGKPVSQSGLPRGALLLAVVRGKEAFIPSGSSVIQCGDRIILISLRKVISAVENILSAAGS